MNWDAIGAVGEIVGALAVVASLVYLATQIRTSNKAVKQAAAQELMNEMREFYSQISSDKSIADLWSKGAMSPEKLAGSEVLQFGLLITQAILIWERILELEGKNEIDLWFTHHANFARDNTIASKGFRVWYKERGQQVSPRMRKVIEDSIAKKNEYSPLGDSFSDSGQN